MEINNRRDFLKLAALAEGGTLVLALILARLAGIDPWRDLAATWPAVGIGVLATTPIFLVYALARETRTVAIETIGPALAFCRWYDLIALAILAGIGEELLFRGVIQPWLGGWSGWLGFVGANVLFGLVHFVTPTYALIAGGLGMYLSVVAFHIPGSNLLSAMIAHGLYDYVAFLLIIREYRRSQPAGPSDPASTVGDVAPDSRPAEDVPAVSPSPPEG